MHQTVCSKCHQDCEVPFRPTGNKPVYCSNCFGSQGGSQRFSPRREYQPNNYQMQFDILNQKLDHILDLLQAAPKPAPDKKPTKKKKVAKK